MAAGLTLAAGAVSAETIKDFAGRYVGSAITRVKQPARYNSVRDRDLDVTIKTSTDGGFELTWTTVFRYRWLKNKKRKQRTTTVTFDPAGRPGLWRAAGSGEPLQGKLMIWARLEGKSLYVYVVAASDGGGLVTATYKRTLSRDGLWLEFFSVRNGQRVRHVTGSLRRMKQ